MTYCHGLGGNQVFAMTKKQQASKLWTSCHLTPSLFQIMSDDNCLDAASGTSPVKLVGGILKDPLFNCFSTIPGAVPWARG